MVKSHPRGGFKHRARLRELAKYYGTVSTSSSIPNIEDELDYEQIDAANFRPLPPRLSADGQLTALAQLAALRLRCQRSFISLVDDNFQHILAEATQSISLFDCVDHSPGEDLVFGAQSLPIGYGFCSRTIKAFLEDEHLYLDRTTNKAGKDYLLVQDIFQEALFRGCPALTTAGLLTGYYLEVPLLSESGYILGSICVLDPEPSVPRDNDVQRLQELAKLVVQHLQWSRMREDHHRAERLLQGLSQFNLGQESISDWSKATPGQPEIPGVHPEPMKLSAKTIASVPQSGGPTTASDPMTVDSSVNTTAHSESSDGMVTSETPVTSQEYLSSHSPTPSTGDGDVEIGFDPPVERRSNDILQASMLAATNVRQAFSRAANLMRESMDLDAACFLEVPQNERFKVSPKECRSTTSQNTPGTFASSTSNSDFSTDPSSSDAATEDEERPKPTVEASPAQVDCHRLGYSTRTKSSLASSNATPSYLTIPANLLSRLTARYPNGRIFHFDSEGAISSGEDGELVEQSSKPKSKRQSISTCLFHQFSSARSLIFFPLYDNDRQQVYAGFLGYTTDPKRALQKNEIVYVSGFANSIMCEVMRLETLALDSAKSNFVSSISHELRSPLHGILGAAQLLSETDICPNQVEYIQMIYSCGRTLLDIMNQLLDHAKINQFTKKQTNNRPHKSRKGLKPQRIESETFSLVTEIDLLSLVEETAASMAADRHEKTQHSNWQSSNTLLLKGGNRQLGQNAVLQLPIILNIPHGRKWTFRSEAGSWRRIIMNLVGNSLKYTDQGYVEVDLTFHETANQEKGNYVELKVSDTGRGISEGYLKHRLYTSFAQEDNLSVGVGLGLSLVRQIVASLNGTIKIHSEVGTGTDVTVQVPLEPVAGPTEGILHDEELLAMTKGRSICFTGFDEQPSIDEQPTGIPSLHTKSLTLMKEALTRLFVDWFGMGFEDSRPPIHVVQEAVLETELQRFDRPDQDLLVIGMVKPTSTPTNVRHANLVYLLPPIGPIRLGHALKALLEARKERAETAQQAALQSPSLCQLSTKESQPAKATKPESKSNDTASITATSAGKDHASQAQQLKPKLDSVVLLVDDNEINIRILVACIERLKPVRLSYVIASNGREALDKYTSLTESGTSIPLVFMDISMPVMDGFTSTREIRAFEKRAKLRKTQRAKIIALTGLASEAAQTEIDSCGFDLYLRKPVELKVVKALLEDHQS